MGEMEIPKQGQIYKHFKNKLYQVSAIAIHSETEEKLVIYQALYGTFGIYARPLESFISRVDKEKYPDAEQEYRFELYEPQETKEAPPLSPIQPQDDGFQNNQSQRNGGFAAEKNYTIMDFLEADTYREKRELLTAMRMYLNDKLINDIAASLDVVVDDGEIETRYNSLLSCLNTMVKFEYSRLR